MKRHDKYLTLVGANIRNMKKARAMGFVKLAERIPMKPESLRRIEKGYATPLLVTLEAIADALEVDVKDFIWG